MESSGLLKGLVMGVAALIISVLIAFVVISNISTVGDSLANPIAATPVVNETNAWLNETGYHLSMENETGFTNARITAVWNRSASGNYNISIGADNATVTAGVITNSTSTYDGMENVSVSYIYEYHATTDASTRAVGNFTAGIDNISGKIPTLFLIAAIVLVLGILVLLWMQYKKMNIGESGGL